PHAARRSPSRLDPLRPPRARVCRAVLRGAVVLHRVSPDGARPEFPVRRGPVGLLEPARAVAVSFLEHPRGSRDGSRTRDRRGPRRGLGATRAVAGQRDGPGEAVSRARGRLLVVAAVTPATPAPVGSPDTYFAAAAVPSAVRAL